MNIRKVQNRTFFWISGLLIVALFCPLLAQAADVQLRARFSQDVIYVRDQAQLNIEVTASSQPIPKPVIPNIDQLSFTEIPTNQFSTMITNGRTQYSRTYTYRVTAGKAGTYEVTPILAVQKGKKYYANRLVLQVLEQGQTAEKSPDFFLRAEVDKDTVYVNEPVLLTFKQYSRWEPTSRLELDLDTSVFKGFWHETVPMRKLYVSTEPVGNVNYRVVKIQQVILFPISTGEITINPVTLVSILEKPGRTSRSRSIFEMDDFFGMGSRSQTRVNMKSNPVTIKVKPLPLKGKPEDFNGAVGQYRLSANVDKTELKVGDALNLKVVIEGRGNLKNLPEPQLPDLDNFERYETTRNEEVSTQDGNLSGKVTFDYLLVPQSEEITGIEPIRFDYFNTILDQYVSEKSNRIVLKVQPSDRRKSDTVLIGSGQRRRSITVLGEDLRYIHTDATDLQPSKANKVSAALAVGMHGVPILLVLGFIGYLRRERRKQNDPVWARQLQAPKQARKGIRECEKLLQAGEAEAFYGALHRLLDSYFSGRFNAAFTGLQSGQRRAILHDNLADESLVERIEAIYSQCDEARFAPGSSEKQTMTNLLNETQQVLQQAAK